MPLTSSAKIDRKLLPAPDAASAAADLPYAPPEGLAEEVLVTVWSEVLALEQVGIDDNFFLLGGDSIRAIQVRARAQKRGLKFSQQQLFEHQTIRALCRVIEFDERPGQQLVRVQPFEMCHDCERLQTAMLEDAYPLTKLQAGMLFHSELDPETAVYHDLHSFHLRLQFDEPKLRAAIQDIAQQHEVLRTSFNLNDYEHPLQLVHRQVEIPLEVEDFRHLSGDSLQRAIEMSLEMQKQRKFRWSEAPLVRFAVQRRTDETVQFVMCFHHSILDGWSAASLLTSLFNRYYLLLRSGAEPLRKLAVAFKDYVAAERKALDDPGHHEFWGKVLEGIQPSNLPRIATRPQAAGPRRSSAFEVTIPEGLSHGLRSIAVKSLVPLKSILLAAHLRAMKAISGNSDVVTGIVSSGRIAEADGENVLGLFLNVLPFRLTVGRGSWIHLMNQTFEAERDMLPYRRYPLAEIQRIAGGQELFETAFNFMHYHVYNNIERLSEAELLDYTGYEETNFALIANFSLEPASKRIHLHLNYLPAEFTRDQVETFAGYYLRILQAMAT
ncbi:MAG: condensation domain-containing protein, partial [Candidatus Angelobacter sp.]